MYRAIVLEEKGGKGAVQKHEGTICPIQTGISGFETGNKEILGKGTKTGLYPGRPAPVQLVTQNSGGPEREYQKGRKAGKKIAGREHKRRKNTSHSESRGVMGRGES